MDMQLFLHTRLLKLKKKNCVCVFEHVSSLFCFVSLFWRSV